VRSIAFNDKGVVSLAASSLHFSNRRGLAQWNLATENMRDLTSMSYGNRGTTELIVGGLQETMLRINLDRGTVISEVSGS